MENYYKTPKSNLVKSADNNLAYEEKLKVYHIAESQLYLLRIGSIALFCHLVPPLLLPIGLFSFSYNYRLSSKIMNKYIAILFSLFAILPIFGLLVMSITVKKSQKRIGVYGFEVTHDKESLEPVKLWINQ